MKPARDVRSLIITHNKHLPRLEYCVQKAKVKNITTADAAATTHPYYIINTTSSTPETRYYGTILVHQKHQQKCYYYIITITIKLLITPNK